MSHLRLRTLHVVRAVGGVVVYDQKVRPVPELYLVMSCSSRTGTACA